MTSTNTPLLLPSGKYSTILVDPPWNTHQHAGNWSGAGHHYDLLSVPKIMALPVGDLTAENAHVWLWCTNATLRLAYDVMEAWGFVPRSPLTWIKPRMGIGVYLRNASEHVLLGTRGRAPVKYRRQPTWIFAPLQDHSHKPEEMFAVIERVSEGPYLELFARRRQPGWDVWGNEIDSDIVIPGYPVPSDARHRRDGRSA